MRSLGECVGVPAAQSRRDCNLLAHAYLLAYQKANPTSIAPRASPHKLLPSTSSSPSSPKPPAPVPSTVDFPTLTAAIVKVAELDGGGPPAIYNQAQKLASEWKSHTSVDVLKTFLVLVSEGNVQALQDMKDLPFSLKASLDPVEHHGVPRMRFDMIRAQSALKGMQEGHALSQMHTQTASILMGHQTLEGKAPSDSE